MFEHVVISASLYTVASSSPIESSSSSPVEKMKVSDLLFALPLRAVVAPKEAGGLGVVFIIENGNWEYCPYPGDVLLVCMPSIPVSVYTREQWEELHHIIRAQSSTSTSAVSTVSAPVQLMLGDIVCREDTLLM